MQCARLVRLLFYAAMKSNVSVAGVARSSCRCTVMILLLFRHQTFCICDLPNRPTYGMF